MATEHSPLTAALADLLERGFGVATNEELRDRLESVVGEHSLEGEKAPAWMFEFVSRMIHRRFTSPAERYEIPTGYPHGENGLCNLLLDIDRDIHALGFDDHGEGTTWPIPGLGVRVNIIREWNAENSYGVEIAPLQT